MNLPKLIFYSYQITNYGRQSPSCSSQFQFGYNFQPLKSCLFQIARSKYRMTEYSKLLSQKLCQNLSWFIESFRRTSLYWTWRIYLHRLFRRSFWRRSQPRCTCRSDPQRTESEQSYDTTEDEILDIVWVFKYFLTFFFVVCIEITFDLFFYTLYTDSLILHLVFQHKEAKLLTENWKFKIRYMIEKLYAKSRNITNKTHLPQKPIKIAFTRSNEIRNSCSIDFQLFKSII